VQVNTILIYCFLIYSCGKLPSLEQREKKEEGYEKKEHLVFSKVLYDLLVMGQVRQKLCSDQHPSLTAGWQDHKRASM